MSAVGEPAAASPGLACGPAAPRSPAGEAPSPSAAWPSPLLVPQSSSSGLAALLILAPPRPLPTTVHQQQA